jgi:hypothetical protein
MLIKDGEEAADGVARLRGCVATIEDMIQVVVVIIIVVVMTVIVRPH